MKKEDLVIGKSYKLFHASDSAQLVSYDNIGDPVLRPIDGFESMTMNTLDDTSNDPALQPGTFSIRLKSFIQNFVEVE